MTHQSPRHHFGNLFSVRDVIRGSRPRFLSGRRSSRIMETSKSTQRIQEEGGIPTMWNTIREGHKVGLNLPSRTGEVVSWSW